MPNPKPRRIIAIGLLVGFLDITAAALQFFIKTGDGPEALLRFVASGLFGKTAFSGGSEMVLAGLLIHFLIAVTFSLLFFLLINNIQLLRKNCLVTGLFYGVFVWFVMNTIVWPLIKVPPRVPDLQRDLTAMGILILCIGIPLAFLLIKKERNEIRS